MKYSLLVCLVLAGATPCHKSGASATSATTGTSGSANYDSITVVGSNPFTNSQLKPQVAISSGNQMIFGIGETPVRISDSVFIFDTEANQWSVTEMPSCHQFAGVTAVDSLVIFAGGQDYPNLSGVTDVEIYTPATRKWTTATLSQARYKLAAASAGPIAAFGGGQTIPGSTVATVDLYNATTGNWTTSALSVPRTLLAAAGAGTKIVFAGGQTNSGAYSDVVDIYDTKTGLWAAAHLSAPRYLITAAVAGSQVLFAGGYNTNGFSDAVDIYDVSTGEWSTSHLRTPCKYSGAAASGNLICFLSSYNLGGASDTVDIYNANTHSWTSAAVLPDDRYTLCGAAMGSQVITLGGNPFQSGIAYYYQLK